MSHHHDHDHSQCTSEHHHHEEEQQQQDDDDTANLLNPNPQVFEVKQIARQQQQNSNDQDTVEQIDDLEIYDMIRNINDPEHPLTLEQLHVAQLQQINVDHEQGTVNIHFTPTVQHCSMATLIGLSIRVKLLRSLPRRFKVDIHVAPGSHQSEIAVNKQLNDKERVAAALENSKLLGVVNKCIQHS